MKEVTYFMILVPLIAVASEQTLMIVNSPISTTVCSGYIVDFPCGFSGANPKLVFPAWRIIEHTGGRVVSNMTINGSYINDGVPVDGLQWVPDLTGGPSDATHSVLRVGPVDETYDQSSYQCSFAVSGEPDVVSSVAVLTVAGIPTVSNLMATDNCLNVTARWDAVTGVCSNSVQFMITLSSSSDTIGPVVTSDTIYTFDETVMLTGDISVSAIPVIGNAMGNSFKVMAHPLQNNVPQISFDDEMERCVSYLSISWNDTTLCMPVSYAVMLVDALSGRVLQSIITSNTSCNFTGLTSNTLYAITINGSNRVGQDADTMYTITLKSDVPPMIMEVMQARVETEGNSDDIMINWKEAMLVNACNTSSVKDYVVQINYSIDTHQFSNNTTVPVHLTSIFMSDYFQGHPSPNIDYKVTVFAENEGGRSDPSIIVTGGFPDHKPSGGEIAAIVSSVVVVFCTSLCIVTLVFKFWKRRKRKFEIASSSRSTGHKFPNLEDNYYFGNWHNIVTIKVSLEESPGGLMYADLDIGKGPAPPGSIFPQEKPTYGQVKPSN